MRVVSLVPSITEALATMPEVELVEIGRAHV